MRFIHNLQEYEGCKISYQQEGKEYQECEDNERNHISSSLIAFENLFDRQDHHKKQKEELKIGNYMEINIGTDKDPKLIKIGKRYFGKGKEQFDQLNQII